jgi:hypothetical protein
MTTREETSTEWSRTAALVLVAYLDVAILGGMALIGHWTGDAGQVQRSETKEGCSADEFTNYGSVCDESVRLPGTMIGGSLHVDSF